MKGDAIWSGIEALIAACLSVLTSFAIARIIGPAELGIGAAATAMHIVLWVVVNALFADALVQRAAINERVLSSAFWASTAVGCIALLLQAGSGWGLAWALNDGRLVPMSLLLAMPFPLVGAAGVVQGLLTRERAYRRLAMRTLIGQGLGTVVGVAAALAGAGGWALVAQQTVTSLVGASALLIGRAWRPTWYIDRSTVKSLLVLGVPLTASTLVLIARYRLFAVLIGASAGPTVLGQVHIAFRLVDTVRELTFTALWRLMLPALSEHQHDCAGLLTQVDRWLRRSACVIFPLCVLMAVLLTQVVEVLMGPNWAQAGQAALPLVGLMVVSTLMFPSSVALVAVGHARFALYGNAASMLLGCTSVLVFRPSDPWHAVLIWTLTQLVVCPYAMLMNARALRVPVLRPLSGGFHIWTRLRAT